METTKNLQKVSLVFFLLIGGVHLLSGLMIANRYFLKESILINRTLDIPFIISALTYGFTSLKLNILKYHRKTVALDVLFVGISILVILIVFYVNFLIPDI